MKKKSKEKESEGKSEIPSGHCVDPTCSSHVGACNNSSCCPQMEDGTTEEIKCDENKTEKSPIKKKSKADMSGHGNNPRWHAGPACNDPLCCLYVEPSTNHYGQLV